ncbi:hypothetical protein ACIQGT_14300 [Streptomyces sp. NPDC093108]|uniref:hypothetical protein n=1 Tax=Streptomyces sp. NPDC093108 TaxID=3366030 RepID=UPI0037F83678
MIAVREIYLTVANAGIFVIVTGEVWGPVLLVLLLGAGAVWWGHRPPGRHRIPSRTPVRTRVRTAMDTGTVPIATTPLNCTDTCPDTPMGLSGQMEGTA